MLKQVIEILNQGGMVIFPTDTAFGIGCRLDRPAAVDRLFKIRQRPLTQAMPVLVDSPHMALAYFLNPSETVLALMREYWPGALTIVAPSKNELIYAPVRGNGKTIGLRMPNHKVALELIQSAGVPILGPSANFHGQPTPYKLADLDPNLVKLVDYVLPGTCPVGQISTVVDCSVTPAKIIRQGAVNLLKIVLYLDSSQTKQTRIKLNVGDKVYELGSEQGLKDQTVLPLIKAVLAKAKIKLTDLQAIEVNPGPGSFTGLRVGYTVAQTLGWLLNIPVNGQPAGKLPPPTYGPSKFD